MNSSVAKSPDLPGGDVTALPEDEIRRINEGAHAILTAFDANALSEMGANPSESDFVPDAEVARINAAAHAVLTAFQPFAYEAD